MARTSTLADLRTRSLQRADMEGTTAFVDTSLGDEVDDYINESVSALYDIIIDSSMQEWYLRSDTITTVSGTEEYDLPSDFYLLKGVDYVNGDVEIPLAPYNFHNRHQDSHFSLLRGWNRRGHPARYRLQGDMVDATGVYTPSLRLTPEPNGVYTLTVWYYPHAPVLDADSDVWDGFNGWEEWVIVDVAMKLLEKEETDTSSLMARRAALEDRIRGLAANRDMGAQEIIFDYEGDFLDEDY